MKKILETFGEEETRALGRALGKTAVPGEVICLDGDLGVGKTVLAQGFAEGLGIAGPVASPTFTIVQTYETGRLPFFHMDVYRGYKALIEADRESGGHRFFTVDASLPPEEVRKRIAAGLDALFGFTAE